MIEIARTAGRTPRHYSNEQGEYMHRNSDYTETLSYSQNQAQMKAEEKFKKAKF